MTSRPSEEPKKVPKDLKVKIGSKEEVFWTELQEKLADDNLNMKRQIELNDHVIEYAQYKITEEKEKFI